MFTRQTRAGAALAVQNLRRKENFAAKAATYRRVVAVPVLVRTEVVLIKKTHATMVAHLRHIIAYDEPMLERTVVYDDDLPALPDASIDEEHPPTQTNPRPTARRHAQPLRQHLSALNQQRSVNLAHDATCGTTPSIVYQPAEDGSHGNFFPASYRRITATPAWASRLQKAYSASRRMAHSHARQRHELDCATSSDALLMNIFCHPTVLRSKPLQALLGVSAPQPPQFGVRAHVALRNHHKDRTELDMVLQDADHLLLVEAKLSEGDFQTAPPALMERYPAFDQVFETDVLPRTRDHLRSYQLLRSILAAHSLQASFTVLLDARRTDLLDDIFLVYRTVRSAGLRSRLHVITWQEIAACVPRSLQQFLAEKCGIVATR